MRLLSYVRIAKATVATIAAFAIAPVVARAADAPSVATDTVTLDGAAFADTSGFIRINQTAGVGNVQSNVAIVGLGRVSDARLDTIVTQTIDPTSKIADLRSHGRVVVSSNALAGARGLIQINESAGNGNASSNAFSLTVQR
ncbi:MAG: hypothetical protein NVS4B5_16800 [Vulcanimicrobiaceae bacterium]